MIYRCTREQTRRTHLIQARTRAQRFLRLPTDGIQTVFPPGIAVGTPIPSGEITGVTDGSDAAAGTLGEYLQVTLSVGAQVSLSTGVAKSLMSMVCSPGDWDMSATVSHNSSGLAQVSVMQAGISLTNNTLPPQAGVGGLFPDPLTIASLAASVLGGVFVQDVGPVRCVLSVPTTIYLVCSDAFLLGTMACYGTLRARRVR